MRIIAHIRSFITAVKIPLLSFFSLSAILNSLFYTLFSRAYNREFRSVLAGRIKYLKESSNGRLNIYHFRRNINRLEKGLIMRPPSEIYALNYIAETVRMYCEIVKNSEGNTELLNEIIWGHDVLKEYFQSSLGFAEKTGFRSGLYFPFQPYNFQEDRQFSFLEFPLMVMDTTLIQSNYMDLSPSESFNLIKKVISEIKKFHGLFVLLWHNNTMAGFKYQIWRKTFFDITMFCRENRAEMKPLAWYTQLYKKYSER